MKKAVKIIATLMAMHALLVCINCSKRLTKPNTAVFTDAMGRQVNVPKSVKRIVSMAPNVTEMLFSIGLDEEIVGVTDFCNYPSAARRKIKIGGYNNPNIEMIISLAPELIVATPDGYSKERVEKLDQAGMPVFLVNPQNIEGVLESTLILGKVIGKEEIAKQVVERARLRVKAITDKVSQIPVQKRPKVFYEIGTDPLITAGPGNFMDDLITTAGGINIAGDALGSWPRYSVEAVIMKNPDIIITSQYHTSSGEKKPSVSVWHRYRTIPAVLNGRIYSVDPDIFLRPGPRIIDGLEKLYDLFYQKPISL